MHQHFTVSPEETVRAKWPHEIFLINLVFNHILVFASTFGVFSTFPLMVLIVPITSFVITGYIIIKAKQIAKSDETWFVKSHWVIAAKRNSYFLRLLTITCTVIGGGLLLSKMMGWSKITTIALLGGIRHVAVHGIVAGADRAGQRFHVSGSPRQIAQAFR